MTLLLLPLIIIAIYGVMYLMRTDRTRECRWLPCRREDGAVDWSCPACGGTARTDKKQPDFCARYRDSGDAD